MLIEKYIIKFVIVVIITISSITSVIIPQDNLITKKLIKKGFWKGNYIRYVANELCVIKETKVSKANIEQVLKPFYGKLKREFNKLNFSVITLPVTIDLFDVAEILSKNSYIKSIEPNMIHTTCYMPNDTEFQNGKQWALNNVGQVGTSGEDIDVTKAWDITMGNSNVIIAVLDTGMPLHNDYTFSHPDLDDPTKFIKGWNFVNNTNGTVKDTEGHGSHVLGIISAETNNSDGIAGIANKCRSLVVKVISDGIGTDESFLDGVEYAVDNGAQIINYSSVYPDSWSYTQALKDAVDYANDHNPPVLIIAAAGNDGLSSIKYPAAFENVYDNVIAVSSLDADGQLSPFSNYNYSSSLIFAPGGYGLPFDTDDIYSTLNTNDSFPNDPLYGYMAGTSQAAPHVSGVAALVLSMNSSLTASQIKTILVNSSNSRKLDTYEALKYTIENYGATLGGSGKTVTFHEDITVISGKTLTIASGTTVKFDAGYGLTIKGTLIADGVTFTSSSTSKWAGISMESASSSSIIKNSTISNATTGISLSNTSMTVETNEIYNTTNYGIYIYGGSPKITDNYIHDTGDYGIAANGAINTYIRKNSIKNCDGGVFSWGNTSHIKMIGYSGYSYGINVIEDYDQLEHGVLVTGGSADLGEYGRSSYKRGYNNIIKGQGSVVKNTTSSEILAEKNYWGGTPATHWFVGSISYDPYLSSANSTSGSTLGKIISTVEPDKLLLFAANELLDSKSYQLASDKYRQLISEYPNSQYGGLALAWSMEVHKLNKDLETQRDYLINKSKHSNKKVKNAARLWLQTLEAESGNKENCAKLVNEIPIEDEIGVEVRLNWANDLLNLYNDKENAEIIFNELISYDAEHAILKTIEAIKKTAHFSANFGFGNGSIDKKVVENFEVSESTLSNAYPNPFNPTTKISYQLQEAGFVSLVVYNSIGQVVVELVNQRKEKGVYNIDFDASDLSSGLYIYRLQVNTPDGKGNYAQAKKMILLR